MSSGLGMCCCVAVFRGCGWFLTQVTLVVFASANDIFFYYPDAWYVFVAASKVRSADRSKHPVSVSSLMPQMILLQISPFRCSNLHVDARVLSVVRYCSIMLPSSCTLVLNLCLSNFKSFLGSQ